jgi:hypothetical protein
LLLACVDAQKLSELLLPLKARLPPAAAALKRHLPPLKRYLQQAMGASDPMVSCLVSASPRVR